MAVPTTIPKEAKRQPKGYALHQSPFYKLRSRRRLAEILFITPRQLRHLTKVENRYNEWDAEDKKGKLRHIEDPKPALKAIHRRVARVLSDIAPPNFLFCPVKDRSYIGNAVQHRHGKVVRSIDVKKYFPSTVSRRVFWFFHNELECGCDVAATLTALLTWKGHLPTGGPASPILSFMAHRDMWLEIGAIAEAAGCTLTVYLDDLAISGASVSEHVMWRIRQQIKRTGLEYHKEKRYSGDVKVVTGMVIKNGELCLPNKRHLKAHELRQKLATSNNAEARKILKRLAGHRAQAKQIAAANSLLKQQ
jgi:reverse transcriptase-like protein